MQNYLIGLRTLQSELYLWKCNSHVPMIFLRNCTDQMSNVSYLNVCCDTQMEIYFNDMGTHTHIYIYLKNQLKLEELHASREHIIFLCKVCRCYSYKVTM